MDYPGVRRLWAEFSFQDHVNAGRETRYGNRRVLARAYQTLADSLNSPSPDGEFHHVPQNVLGPASFSRGWKEALTPEEKPWL